MIEFMEELPDVTLTMLSGKKVVVRNSPEEIIEQIVAYRSRLGITKQEL